MRKLLLFVIQNYVKIVEERISFDQSPQTWFEKYESEQFSIQDRIIPKFIK
jgi:Mg-chelatase subunit ChlI